MKSTMPQEIEVWYILPAIRRELANSMLKEFNLKQREIAKLLRITDSAVSQYLKSKRAKEVQFSSQMLGEVKASAEQIIKNPDGLIEETNRLCGLIKKDEVLCKLHRYHDKTVPANCCACLKSFKEGENVQHIHG